MGGRLGTILYLAIGRTFISAMNLINTVVSSEGEGGQGTVAEGQHQVDTLTAHSDRPVRKTMISS